MSVVKFNKDKQKKIKGLSKAIYIIAKIAKILVTIAIPFVLLFSILLTLFVSKIDYKDDVLSFNGETIGKFELVETNDQGASLRINAEGIEKTDIKLSDIDKDMVLKVKDAINSVSKSSVVAYMILAIITITANLVLVRMYLKHFEVLFKNINTGDTPFTLENVSHIKKIAYIMIATIVVPMVFSIISSFIINTDFNIGSTSVSIIEILLLFSMAYIFEYGYEIQQDSQGKIYGDVDEGKQE